MKLGLFIVSFLLTVAAPAQDRSVHGSQLGSSLDKCLKAEGEGAITPDTRRFLSFAEDLSANNKTSLYSLFAKTHQRFLLNFDESSSLNETVRTGTYNCLTATILYALLLEQHKFNYKVIETNYHIFIVVQTEKGLVLLETTDPANGFIDDPVEVQARLQSYRQDALIQPTASEGQSGYAFKKRIYRVVTLDQLTGLLLYNQAIRAVNNSELKSAREFLVRSQAYYASQRTEELMTLIDALEAKAIPSF